MPYAFATAVAPTSGSASQSIPLALGGEAPKAIIVLATRATALDTITNGACCSAAISDGTTTRLKASMAEDGQLTATADTGLDDDNGTKIVRILSAADETIDGEADLTSLDVDGITINWGNFPGTAVQILVIAFYGARLFAKVGSVNCSTTLNGTATVTAVAFRPVAMVQLGCRGNFLSTGDADSHLGFVAFNSDGTIQGQAGYAARDLDRQATATSSGSDIRDDSVGERITGGTGAAEARFEVTSGTSDGFVVTTRVAGAFAYAVGYLLLGIEGRATVGVVQIGTNSTGNKTVSGILGNPGAVFFIGSALGAKNTYTNTGPCSNWSFGVGIPSIGGANIGWGVSDGQVTSLTRCATSATHCLGVIDDSGGTDWSATFVSSADGQFVVNVDDASPADRFIAYLALEERKDIGWLDAIPGRRWRRCLARR